MVTKRGRKWIARGTLVTVLVVVAVLGTSTWVLSSSIRSHLLAMPQPEPAVLVRSVGRTQVTVERTDRTVLPGRWGLRSATGYAELGEVTSVDDESVTRRMLRREGVLAPGLAEFDASTFGSDPSVRGVPFREVILDGPSGDLPAWSIPGRDDTWVVFVHDFGDDRAASLRTLGVTARLGLPMVVPALAGDPAIVDDGRHSSLGGSEWREVEAAIRHAFDSGAEDIVLVGHGTGGSAALVALQRSRYSQFIVGVVLDSPLLDPALLAQSELSGSNTPGFLIDWAKAAATFRYGIDWSDLDHLTRAMEIEVPLLIFHGSADRRFPVEASEVFALLAPDADLVVVPDAPHDASWNLDSLGYERALETFLRRVAVGPSSATEGDS